MTRDLPDDMIDAAPDGGWAGEDVADAGTESGRADAVSQFQEEAPDVEVATGERRGDPVSTGAVEGAPDGAEGADPDLVTDDQAQGQAER